MTWYRIAREINDSTYYYNEVDNMIMQYHYDNKVAIFKLKLK